MSSLGAGPLDTRLDRDLIRDGDLGTRVKETELA